MARPGPRMLLTRPRFQSERFAADCARRFGTGVDILISPILDIAVTGALPDLAGFDGLIFTSENGVRSFAKISLNRGLPAFCVGERTAAAARAAGLTATVLGPNADGLVSALSEREGFGRLLHIRGRHARGEVAERMTAMGRPCDEALIYEQIPQELSLNAAKALNEDDPLILPLFSPRSAALVGRAAQGARAPLAVAALSPAVMDAWQGPAPVVRDCAAEPHADSLLEAIERVIAALRRLEGGQRPL